MHTLNFKMKTIKTSATLCVSLLILSIVLVIKSHMKLSILNNEDVILSIPPLTQMLDFMSLIDRHSSIDPGCLIFQHWLGLSRPSTLFWKELGLTFQSWLPKEANGHCSAVPGNRFLVYRLWPVYRALREQM